ncbi:pyridoxamine 5'-phosphate oxidase family protein [Leptolyngbya sp. FACHB-711]|uniref:pyridoxamine 5'-phosphate oxidase family protein n=1 Tax=unclassified Leptolyngbya TaxID=2650499 RepID=UPI001688A617|nr:pyridoxamine 5'-phosphate oxidase family protein [Cyanobacteria bacterium FACHB-502]MBD2026177.1 pyridoxamine 5'-phosphate oxidase family protein [Leptolyngbya sp. FACHB-711]
MNPETNDRDTESNSLEITQRTQIKRLPQRGNYDRPLIHQILDEGLICQVGFVVEGQPFVIPTAYGRVDDRLYLHGSPASRMLRTLKQDVEVCVTVTLLDGLVLARSAFHHSMNYRSVVVFGRAEVVEDAAEKIAALKAFTEHVMPGRWSELRPATQQEIAGTLVLSLPLNEASAKVRTGPPKDDEADYELPIWAGELPLRLTPLAPVADPQLSVNVDVPSSVQQYSRSLLEAAE